VKDNADAGLRPAGTPACDTLYYDGQCPLCNAEVQELRQVRGATLRTVDIHQAGSAADLPEREALLRTLHLRRADGSWEYGADANVAAWEGTARWRWLRMLRWPLLRWPVDLVYALWARLRYRRLYRNPRSAAD